METDKDIGRQQEVAYLRDYWKEIMDEEYANIMADAVISQLYPKRQKEEFRWKPIKI